MLRHMINQYQKCHNLVLFEENVSLQYNFRPERNIFDYNTNHIVLAISLENVYKSLKGPNTFCYVLSVHSKRYKKVSVYIPKVGY